jgi:hypothetical protein
VPVHHLDNSLDITVKVTLEGVVGANLAFTISSQIAVIKSASHPNQLEPVGPSLRVH